MTRYELEKVKRLHSELSTLKERHAGIIDSLNRLNTELNGLPKSHNTESRLASLVSLMIDIEKQIADLQAELANTRADVTTEIFSATNLSKNEVTVIMRRYVDLLPFATIASELNYSENCIFTYHRQALKKLGIRRK